MAAAKPGVVHRVLLVGEDHFEAKQLLKSFMAVYYPRADVRLVTTSYVTRHRFSADGPRYHFAHALPTEAAAAPGRPTCQVRLEVAPVDDLPPLGEVDGYVAVIPAAGRDPRSLLGAACRLLSAVQLHLRPGWPFPGSLLLTGLDPLLEEGPQAAVRREAAAETVRRVRAVLVEDSEPPPYGVQLPWAPLARVAALPSWRMDRLRHVQRLRAEIESAVDAAVLFGRLRTAQCPEVVWAEAPDAQENPVEPLDAQEDYMEAPDAQEDSVEASDPQENSVEAPNPREDSVEASDPREDSVEASDPREGPVEVSDPQEGPVEASDPREGPVEARDPLGASLLEQVAWRVEKIDMEWEELDFRFEGEMDGEPPRSRR